LTTARRTPFPYTTLFRSGIQVDTNATLTIEEGCRIYMHADAPFIVDGTLLVQGDKYDSTKVIFRGDRLDVPYRDFPAGWPGIYLDRKSTRLNSSHVKISY